MFKLNPQNIAIPGLSPEHHRHDGDSLIEPEIQASQVWAHLRQQEPNEKGELLPYQLKTLRRL